MDVRSDWKREALWCTLGVVIGVILTPPLSPLAAWAWDHVGVNQSAPATPAAQPVVRIAPPICDTSGSHAPGQTLELKIRRNDRECWQPEISPIVAGTTAEILIGYANYSGAKVDNVTLVAQLPSGVTLVPKTSYLKNGLNPDGKLRISDNIAGRGVNISNYNDKSNAYLRFRVSISADFKCGKTPAPVKLTSYSSTNPEQLMATMDMNIWDLCKP